jgi:hypothetical protein
MKNHQWHLFVNNLMWKVVFITSDFQSTLHNLLQRYSNYHWLISWCMLWSYIELYCIIIEHYILFNKEMKFGYFFLSITLTFITQWIAVKIELSLCFDIKYLQARYKLNFLNTEKYMLWKPIWPYGQTDKQRHTIIHSECLGVYKNL